MACSPKFGQHPQGERLKRVEASPNYQNGAFRNQIPTPLFSEDNNVFTLLLSSLSSPEIRRRPEVPVPSVKTDLNALDVNKDVIVWLGHSSLVLRLGGKSFLVDPVFSNYAAPFSSFNKAFAGTNIYSVDDMPDIDYLLIMHDHWDHLDYPTITGLKSKVRHVICGLGVGAHLEYWGYDRDIITEGDWYDSLVQEDGMSIHIVPARHSSGRFLTRNKTLWAGFVVETPEHRIFISGDTGFGPHFAETGKRFGGFDLAILENGQYDPRWPYTHMAPEETVQAAKDLRARAVLPVHSGKFSLAPHPWDEPLIRLASASQGESWQLLTPMMGEPVYPDNVEQPFTTWWVNMKH
jgi:L-ascorbate metabolism protein UlaG (beta-lactamase superfamily)